MIILLLVAVVLWLIQAVIPVAAALSALVGWISWGWAGLVFFGVWLLMGGAERLLAFARRPPPS
jgi:hypothetical protein